MTVFAHEYMHVFTTGFHYAFGVAILAMVLSLVLFVINRKKFPDPSKKVAAKMCIRDRLIGYYIAFCVFMFILKGDLDATAFQLGWAL